MRDDVFVVVGVMMIKFFPCSLGLVYVYLFQEILIFIAFLKINKLKAWLIIN
jgi:hypothetical protein